MNGFIHHPQINERVHLSKCKPPNSSWLLDMARIADPQHRDRILDAARRTFRRRGYVGAPMAEIARGAGIAVGTLYLYFESKEAIARAITAQRFEAAVRIVIPALERPLTRPRIRRMVYDTFDAVFADPAFGTPDLPLGDVS